MWSIVKVSQLVGEIWFLKGHSVVYRGTERGERQGMNISWASLWSHTTLHFEFSVISILNPFGKLLSFPFCRWTNLRLSFWAFKKINPCLHSWLSDSDIFQTQVYQTPKPMPFLKPSVISEGQKEWMSQCHVKSKMRQRDQVTKIVDLTFRHLKTYRVVTYLPILISADISGRC